MEEKKEEIKPEQLDLSTIKIRKNFKEPRIHFAVNCASISCPSLLQSSFVGKTINIQLDKAAKQLKKQGIKLTYDESMDVS